jgi:hypothetical protein
VIGDSNTPTRSGTPRPTHEKEPTGSSEASTEGARESSDGQAQEKAAVNEMAPPDLPKEVRVKLRKLDKLESKYNGPSESYITLFYTDVVQSYSGLIGLRMPGS